MQKETSRALDRAACNCLALRQAARHVSQLYDSSSIENCVVRRPSDAR
jgi:hypothetical protein